MKVLYFNIEKGECDIDLIEHKHIDGSDINTTPMPLKLDKKLSEKLETWCSGTKIMKFEEFKKGIDDLERN